MVQSGGCGFGGGGGDEQGDYDDDGIQAINQPGIRTLYIR